MNLSWSTFALDGMNAQHVRLFVTPWIIEFQAPLSIHGISSKNTGVGLPFPLPEDLPNPGIKLASPKSPDWQAGSLPLGYLGSPRFALKHLLWPVKTEVGLEASPHPGRMH